MKPYRLNGQLIADETQDDDSSNSIMVVDDSKFARNILCDILRNDGFNVVAEAKNGLEAIELSKEKRPKYIFLDVEMPVLDGLGAIPKILEADPQAHIIMCTAMGQKNIIVEAVKAGAKDYVIKPYKKENILRVLNVIIEAKKRDEKNNPAGREKPKNDELRDEKLRNEEPKYEKPGNAGSKGEEPRNEKPKYEKNGNEEPKYVEPGNDEPKYVEPGNDELKNEELKNEEQKIEEHKIEELKNVVLKNDELSDKSKGKPSEGITNQDYSSIAAEKEISPKEPAVSLLGKGAGSWDAPEDIEETMQVLNPEPVMKQEFKELFGVHNESISTKEEDASTDRKEETYLSESTAGNIIEAVNAEESDIAAVDGLEVYSPKEQKITALNKQENILEESELTGADSLKEFDTREQEVIVSNIAEAINVEESDIAAVDGLDIYSPKEPITADILEAAKPLETEATVLTETLPSNESESSESSIAVAADFSQIDGQAAIPVMERSKEVSTSQAAEEAVNLVITENSIAETEEQPMIENTDIITAEADFVNSCDIVTEQHQEIEEAEADEKEACETIPIEGTGDSVTEAAAALLVEEESPVYEDSALLLEGLDSKEDNELRELLEKMSENELIMEADPLTYMEEIKPAARKRKESMIHITGKEDSNGEFLDAALDYYFFSYLWKERFEQKQEDAVQYDEQGRKLSFHRVLLQQNSNSKLSDTENASFGILSGLVSSVLGKTYRLQPKESSNDLQAGTYQEVTRLFVRTILTERQENRTDITMSDVLNSRGNQEMNKVIIRTNNLSKAIIQLVQGKAERILQ